MAYQIERDGARKMSGEDQMMFQDHVPFVDKVRNGGGKSDYFFLRVLRSCNSRYNTIDESILRLLKIQSELLLAQLLVYIPCSPISRTVI